MVDIKEIKEIPVIAFAVIIATITAIIMFIIGIIMAILGASMFSIMPMMWDVTSVNLGWASALYLIIIMPLMMFICVFILGAVAAIIYNALAPRIGGIKLKFE